MTVAGMRRPDSLGAFATKERRSQGLRRLQRLHKAHPRLLLYIGAAAVGLLQFFVVWSLLGPSAPPAPKTLGEFQAGKSLGNEKVVIKDLWQKYFSHEDAVPWPEFAVHLLVHKSGEMRELPLSMQDSLGELIDLNGDGRVTHKEFQRGMLHNGEVGITRALEKLVNTTLDRAVSERETRMHPHDTMGCAAGLHGAHYNFVEVPRSQDLQFPGDTEFCVEMWIHPNVTSEQHKTYGGTLISKYNRGHLGQFFITLEHSGDLFFHRETPPWGLRSNGVHIPPGVYTHVAVSFGGGRSKLFINGTLRGSQLEGHMAPDAETPLLLGAIYDNGKPTFGFHGLLDEVRVWGIDRTQVEIQSTMHTKVSGIEIGLLAYWGFDECAGGIVRDKMGRHDGILHGGRWHSSPVRLLDTADAKQVAKVAEGGDEHDELQDMVAKGDKLNFNYWKRAIGILEDQIRINRLVLKRKAEYADLIKRVKALEKSDSKLSRTVATINQRNVNLTRGLEEMGGNLTRHENTTGLFGSSYSGDIADMVDDDVPLDGWLEWLESEIPGMTAEDEEWRSFEETEEARLELEEGISLATADPEEAAKIKAKHKKKMQLLPAIELAVKSGFEAEEHALEVLATYNSGTFNERGVDLGDESEEAEYAALLKKKGYSAKRIAALLKKRRAAAGEDLSTLPVSELLERSDLEDLVMKRATKKGKRPAPIKPKKKAKRPAKLHAAETDEDAPEAEAEGAGAAGVARSKSGIRKKRRREEEDSPYGLEDAMQDYSFDLQHGKGGTKAAAQDNEDYEDETEEEEEPLPRPKKVKPKPEKQGLTEGKEAAAEEAAHAQKGVQPVKKKELPRLNWPYYEGEGAATAEAAKPHDEKPEPTNTELDPEELMIDTLVSGMVPKVGEMLKLDTADNRLTPEARAKAASKKAKREAETYNLENDDLEDFGEKEEMPEALQLQMEKDLGLAHKGKSQRGRKGVKGGEVATDGQKQNGTRDDESEAAEEEEDDDEADSEEPPRKRARPSKLALEGGGGAAAVLMPKLKKQQELKWTTPSDRDELV